MRRLVSLLPFWRSCRRIASHQRLASQPAGDYLVCGYIRLTRKLKQRGVNMACHCLEPYKISFAAGQACATGGPDENSCSMSQMDDRNLVQKPHRDRVVRYECVNSARRYDTPLVDGRYREELGIWHTLRPYTYCWNYEANWRNMAFIEASTSSRAMKIEPVGIRVSPGEQMNVSIGGMGIFSWKRSPRS